MSMRFYNEIIHNNNSTAVRTMTIDQQKKKKSSNDFMFNLKLCDLETTMTHFRWGQARRIQVAFVGIYIHSGLVRDRTHIVSPAHCMQCTRLTV